MPKWADVYLRKDGFQELEYKLGFLMDKTPMAREPRTIL